MSHVTASLMKHEAFMPYITTSICCLPVWSLLRGWLFLSFFLKRYTYVIHTTYLMNQSLFALKQCVYAYTDICIYIHTHIHVHAARHNIRKYINLCERYDGTSVHTQHTRAHTHIRTYILSLSISLSVSLSLSLSLSPSHSLSLSLSLALSVSGRVHVRSCKLGHGRTFAAQPV